MPTARVTIRPAQLTDLEAVAALFDQYRQFYRQPGDPALARAFLEQRHTRGESVLLIAEQTPRAVLGFTQLYPTFCSVAAAPIFVLYDLFVTPSARRRGIGRALLDTAASHAARAGAVRVELATARTNLPAQRLYESLGWVRDDEFFRYALVMGQK
jgi:ribosomal protein S18 acetylase RimI-like enzyme